MAQDPNTEIEPLSDENLEEVAGGCSGSFCSHAD